MRTMSAHAARASASMTAQCRAQRGRVHLRPRGASLQAPLGLAVRAAVCHSGSINMSHMPVGLFIARVACTGGVSLLARPCATQSRGARGDQGGARTHPRRSRPVGSACRAAAATRARAARGRARPAKPLARAYPAFRGPPCRVAPSHLSERLPASVARPRESPLSAASDVPPVFDRVVVPRVRTQPLVPAFSPDMPGGGAARTCAHVRG